jgi:hypothetical protein
LLSEPSDKLIWIDEFAAVDLAGGKLATVERGGDDVTVKAGITRRLPDGQNGR